MNNHLPFAMAIAAHLDDIKFMMAGTLLHLKETGCSLHYMNVANGSCGSMTFVSEEITAIQTGEAQQAAELLGTTFYTPLVNDIEIFYAREFLACVGAIVREVAPMTVAQNARTSGCGNISMFLTQACTVGPVETWKNEKVSIWHAGTHDNPFGMRLTTMVIGKQLPEASVPMSLWADRPNLQFNFYRPAIGTCGVEID